MSYKIVSLGERSNGSEARFDSIDNKYSKLIEAVLYSLDDKLVYRGVDTASYSNFLEAIFMVGEKARYFLFHEFNNGLSYQEYEKINPKEAYNNIKDKVKEGLKGCQKYRVYPKKDVIFEIESYRKRNGRSYYDMYIMLLCWLHTMQDVTSYQSVIPCVSTSFNKSTAQKYFAKNLEYTVVAFLNKSEICNVVYTKRIKQFTECVGVTGFEDKYEEVIFLDCIFPQNILGVIKKYINQEMFIVNPYFLNMIKKCYESTSFSDLISTLLDNGIKIDQYKFYEVLEKSKWEKWILQDKNRRCFKECQKKQR